MIRTKTDMTNVQSYYDDCAVMINDDAKAMGWSSTFNQQLRFDVMNYMVDMSNCSVLDVGCGDGALFHYFMKHNITATYKGVDISSKMVSRAHNRFPGINVRCADFFDIREQFDVVVCSGSLSMAKNVDSMTYLESAIDHLLSITKSQLVFNLLSDYAPSTSDLFNRYHPQDVLALCFKKTRYVNLNHGYLPNDFTIQLIKE